MSGEEQMADIIDNRERKLADTIRQYLQLSRQAHFAVGYFYLGGFAAIASALPGVEKLRLLIGPATSRATAEELARAYPLAYQLEQAWQKETFLRGKDRHAMAEATAMHFQETLALLEQTEASERMIAELADLVKRGIIEVRVYAREPLHAKCYIFDERDPKRAQTDPGWVIVGSSNLTLSGITSNTELNVVLHEPGAHRQVSAWFEKLWQEAEEFTPALLRVVQRSWALNEQVTPYDIYLKTLYNLFREQLEAETRRDEVVDKLFPELAEFQRTAFLWARNVLQKYGGVFIADVVGLGKSYIGLALLKWGREQGMRPLIICPASLESMWKAYSETYDVGAPVVSMGVLQETKEGAGRSPLDDPRYEFRNLVLIDESHHFRHTNTQRYRVLQEWLQREERQVIMLTATPMATSMRDISAQLRLWPDYGGRLPIGGRGLEELFREAEEQNDPAVLQELLGQIMIRRPRWYIAETYGEWRGPEGQPCEGPAETERQKQFCPVIKIGEKEYTFPWRELADPVSYRIDEAYPGVYEMIRAVIDPDYESEAFCPTAVLARIAEARAGRGQPLTEEERSALRTCLAQRLLYARYGLYEYVRPEYRKKEQYRRLAAAGKNLRGLMRVLLFKRFESSAEAFRVTCHKLAGVHQRFLEAMAEGKMPAGEEMQRVLYDLALEDRTAEEILAKLEEEEQAAGVRYEPAAFDEAALRRDLESDGRLFQALADLVSAITPAKDAKLQRLCRLLEEEIPANEKVIIFTQFEDTARYLYEALKDQEEVEWVSGQHKQITEIVARFAPQANPHLAERYRSKSPIRILIATDVLAEGLNLQEARYVVNYDLHFNPTRLIQRVGRIDRLIPYVPSEGSRHRETVRAYNFFPETALETHLGLAEKVRRRIEEMRRLIGLESPILHPSEQLDDQGVFAIYTRDSTVLDQPESEEWRSSLLEGEKLLRRLMAEEPERFERIAQLPDGVRSARQQADGSRYFVYCQAGSLHRLYLVSADGDVLSTNPDEALRAIACVEEEPRGKLPKEINRVVSRIKREFDAEVEKQQAQRQQQPHLGRSQKWVLRQLDVERAQIPLAMDPAEAQRRREQIDMLSESYRQPLPEVVRKSLNSLQKKKATGDALIGELMKLREQYRLGRPRVSPAANEEKAELPRIICSEAL